MKLDFDLILAILLFAEEKCDGRGGIEISPSDLPEQFRHVDEFVFREHASDAMGRGFIKGDFTFGKCYIDGLTPEGHKLLEVQRADVIAKRKQWINAILKWIKKALKWLFVTIAGTVVGYYVLRFFR